MVPIPFILIGSLSMMIHIDYCGLDPVELVVLLRELIDHIVFLDMDSDRVYIMFIDGSRIINNLFVSFKSFNPITQKVLSRTGCGTGMNEFTVIGLSLILIGLLLLVQSP